MWLTSLLRRRLFMQDFATRRRQSAGRFRPGIETLEDRLVPTLGLSTSLPVGPYPSAVATADLNRDSKLDIIVANQGYADGPGSVSVMLGKGGRTGFDVARKYDLGMSPTSLVTGDFNGDGWLDVAAASRTGGGEILVN